MDTLFLVAAVVTTAASLMVITRSEVVHALLYLVASFLGGAVALFALGAPFAAALDVVVYAGAILVLFVFAVMLLDLSATGVARERAWIAPTAWAGPAVLGGALLLGLGWTVAGDTATLAAPWIGPKAVGIALYGPYLVGVELVSFLLLAALVGAWHLGRGGAKP